MYLETDNIVSYVKNLEIENGFVCCCCFFFVCLVFFFFCFFFFCCWVFFLLLFFFFFFFGGGGFVVVGFLSESSLTAPILGIFFQVLNYFRLALITH